MSGGKSLVSVMAAGLAPRTKAQAISTVSSPGGWFSLIREPWGGAFQQNVAVDGQRDILAFSAIFACVTVIAQDIAKLRLRIVEEDDDGICTEIEPPAFAPVLRKPNHYQTRGKFIEQWVVSKLLAGNTYALKVRDARRVVTEMYVLNPARVTPLVAESGDVYYQIASDYLSGVKDQMVVPASEIIHDTMVSLFHPLVGISPLYAAAISATQGRRIQSNSTKFFDNMSRPSGVLTAPGAITDEEATRLKARFEEGFSSGNLGRLMVAGGGMKYEAMTIPAEQAQLIEQLRWTVEDVARCFHIPLYKIGGPVPAGSTIDALNQAYYSDCLQALIESAEAHLDEGLQLPADYYTDFDLDGLLRMDQTAQIMALKESVAGSIRAPNEARAKMNLKPVEGGESPMAQQQNYSLAALAKRDAQEDPFGTKPAPVPAALPAPADDAANDEDAAQEAAALADLFIRGIMGGAMPGRSAEPPELRHSMGMVDALAAKVSGNAVEIVGIMERFRSIENNMSSMIGAIEKASHVNAAVAKNVDQLAQVMKMDVEPVYDERGVLKGARRVTKKKEKV